MKSALSSATREVKVLLGFSVENYRSFHALASVPLKPITLLLGRNSSGKSSLTRLLPILRSSIDRQTSSPVLWTNEDVDFGNIRNVVNHAYQNKPVEIGLEIDGRDYGRYLDERISWSRGERGQIGPKKIKFTAKLTVHGEKTVYSSTKIDCDDVSMEAFWAENSTIKSFKFGNKKHTTGAEFSEVFVDTSQLFPDFSFMITDGDNKRVVRRRTWMFYKSVADRLKYFLHQKTSLQKQADLAHRLHYVPRDSLADFLSTLDHVVARRLKHTEALDELFDAIVLNEFPNFLNYVSSVALPQLLSSTYLGPARASGARFYRIQELAAGSVDSQGANLAMYINSLNSHEMSTFNKILNDSCGYVVKIDNIPGHLSIQIGQQGDLNFENLADVGFGFSQFLPIVAQIHAGAGRSRGGFDPRLGFRRYGDPLLAIEQPELHLHPGFQAGLGDLFAGSVRSASGSLSGVRFLIETHSEALVSRLGSLVARGKLMKEDVAICFVDKSETTKFSELEAREFSDDGTINDWPIGFFAAEPIN